jgi:hypothetical protein
MVVFYLERQFKWQVGFAAKGNHMTTPEQVLVRRRLQILEDEGIQRMLDTLEQEDAWVKGFVSRFTEVLRKFGK